MTAIPDGKPGGDPALDQTIDGQPGGALDATLEPTPAAALPTDAGLDATMDGGDLTKQTAQQASAVSLSFPVQEWDRYELIKLLGKGGMGAVYEARDKRLGRQVALKFIHSANPETAARFLQEARAQVRINHPNVCKVYEVGEVDGHPYIAMQLVNGQSLAQAEQAMTVPEKVQAIKTVAEAIHEAHTLGIIHRDL